jgi:putative ABC transport system permease protein
MSDMRLDDAFNYSMRNLSNQKLRSWLTILGIVIGVMTIITIMSIGEGLKKSITSELESFGSDRMFIVPMNLEKSGISPSAMSKPTSGKLFEKDVSQIMKVPGIKSVSKMVYGRSSIQFEDKKIGALVYATTANIFEQWSSMYKLESGRYLSDSDRKVTVLGNDAANTLFGKKQLRVGNYLLINGEKYRVVGVLEKIGTTLSQSDDASIFVPFDDGKELFVGQLSKDELSFISIQTDKDYDAEKIKEAIDFELAALHRVTLDDKDFTVITSDFVNKTIGSILDMVTLFLFMITVISAIVGGIGIANTMFMSVVERTKEIGIMKSIGATRTDILVLFLIESAIIGVVGGGIGVVIGLFLLYILSNFGVPVLVEPGLIIFAVLFSAAVGLISGVFPARKAAGLDAVEALRYD